MIPGRKVKYRCAVRADLSNRLDEVPERFVPDAMAGELVEAEHLARYWWAAALAGGCRVLDAGCGLGYGTNLLAASGAAEVVGVDVAEAVVEAATGGAVPGARFAVASIHDLPFEDSSFDLVVCFEVLEHVERAPEAVAELVRVLAPGGVLAVSSPNPDVYVPGNPHHVHEFSADELRSVLAAHLPHVEVRPQHNLIVSAVLTGGQGTTHVPEPIPAAEIAQVVAATQDAAPYSVALASREPLPPVPVRMVATGLTEVRRWLELYQSQQELLSAQKAYFDQQGAIGAELGELHAQLRRSEEEISRYVDVTASERQGRLDAESQRAIYADRVARADRVLREMRSSLSWRLTAPLRRVKRLLAR